MVLGKPINYYTLSHSKLVDLYVFLINRFEIALSGLPRWKNIGKATRLFRSVFVHLYFAQSCPFFDLKCVSVIWFASIWILVGTTKLGSPSRVDHPAWDPKILLPIAAWILSSFVIHSVVDFVCYPSILGYYVSYVCSGHFIWQWLIWLLLLLR